MEHSLLEKVLELVQKQVDNAKTDEEKAENIQLLEQLKKEKKLSSKSTNFFLALIKNVATHEIIEYIKDYFIE